MGAGAGMERDVKQQSARPRKNVSKFGDVVEGERDVCKSEGRNIWRNWDSGSELCYGNKGVRNV